MIVRRLNPSYPAEEARSIAMLLLEELFAIERTTILAGKAIEWPSDQAQQLENALARLTEGEPVQHVLGFCWFYGRRFKVNRHVLVPRQETEELVHWIVKTHGQEAGMSLLDIGTGSGCIPITVQLEAPSVSCEGWDVSKEALQVALQNAGELEAAVKFEQADIFSTSIPPGKFSLIVSNPPYVRDSEKPLMQRNVLAYDPPEALFVPDEDPLIFYRHIARLAIGSLVAGGWVYFEINEALGMETAALLTNAGFADVELKKDLNGKDRMLRGRKPL